MTAMCGEDDAVRHGGAGSKERSELGVVSRSSRAPPDAGEHFSTQRRVTSTGRYVCGVAWRSPRPTKRGASAEVDTGPEWSLCIGCPHIGAWGGAASQTMFGNRELGIGNWCACSKSQIPNSLIGWVERGVCAAAASGGSRRATARHRRLGTARGGCRSVRDADAHATARQGAVA